MEMVDMRKKDPELVWLKKKAMETEMDPKLDGTMELMEMEEL